jgi:hypothetical protein
MVRACRQHELEMATLAEHRQTGAFHLVLAPPDSAVPERGRLGINLCGCAAFEQRSRERKVRLRTGGAAERAKAQARTTLLTRLPRGYRAY